MGGGRSSARETVGRVAAGAIAKKLLKAMKIKTFGFVQQIGNIKCEKININYNNCFSYRAIRTWNFKLFI